MPRVAWFKRYMPDPEKVSVAESLRFSAVDARFPPWHLPPPLGIARRRAVAAFILMLMQMLLQAVWRWIRSTTPPSIIFIDQSDHDAPGLIAPRCAYYAGAARALADHLTWEWISL